MTQNWHIYAIYSEPEVADDAISWKNVKTIEGHRLVIFEYANSRSIKDYFVTAAEADIDYSIMRYAIVSVSHKMQEQRTHTFCS